MGHGVKQSAQGDRQQITSVWVVPYVPLRGEVSLELMHLRALCATVPFRGWGRGSFLIKLEVTHGAYCSFMRRRRLKTGDLRPAVAQR